MNDWWPPVSEQPLIVLKFGGSVLLDEQRLRIAVHEIYRWRRQGWRVLAVVSALAGRTDELIARCSQLTAGAPRSAQAALISSGEQESASLLGEHLDRAGIPAQVHTPASVSLIASGDPLDADPTSMRRDRLERDLESDGVVVFPGFSGIDEHGEAVTFGRGGSDLTAIFLADALGADRCRLIKDVDGLYESDPSKPGPIPRRYAHAGYAQAMSTDGSILQHKAVRFAQARGVVFEIGRFNGTRPTTIGAGVTTFSTQNDAPRPLSVALCGLGTVGAGVAGLLVQLPELFEVVGAASKDPSKHADLIGAVGPITSDAVQLASRGLDVVVETIGGVDTPLAVAQSALLNGSDLVTANKALIAQFGDGLAAIAEESDRRIHASASVGGCTPVLEAVHGRAVRSVRGVLNGTGNFVLNAVSEGQDFDDAIARAQELGFAEADPSRDLDGRDALDKLLVIAAALVWEIPPSAISREPIGVQHTPDGCVRHVATVRDGSASVHIEEVDPAGLFGQLRNEWNAAEIEFKDGTVALVRGKGAGRWPTSESVLADLLEISRMRSAEKIRIREVGHA